VLVPRRRALLRLRAEDGKHRQVAWWPAPASTSTTRGLIKKHEKTRADKEEDRVRQSTPWRRHDEPVFSPTGPCPHRRLVAEVQRAAARVRSRDATRWGTSSGWSPTDRGQAGALSASAGLYVAHGTTVGGGVAVHARRAGQPGDHAQFLAVVYPARPDADPRLQPAGARSAARTPWRCWRPLQEGPRPRAGGGGRPTIRRPSASTSASAGPRPRPAGHLPAEDPVQPRLLAGAGPDLEPIFGIEDPRTSKDVDFVGASAATRSWSGAWTGRAGRWRSTSTRTRSSR